MASFHFVGGLAALALYHDRVRLRYSIINPVDRFVRLSGVASQGPENRALPGESAPFLKLQIKSLFQKTKV
jgi:hypothetical protein